MSDSLRVALLLDPLSLFLDEPWSLSVKFADQAKELGSELMGRGHVVRGFGAPPGRIPRSGEDPAESASPSPLRGKIQKFQPDVIVAYDALSPAAVRGARMARKLSCALILVEGAIPPVGRPIQRALHRMGQWMWGPYVRRTADAVVALDPMARTQALNEGFEPRLIEVVPPGVDLKRFRPGLTSPLVARHHISGRILLYVGQLVSGRGLEVLVPAFARTVGQRSDWSLVLAGDGPAKARLRAMADRLGIAARVHWIGRPRPEELPGLMGASTLFAVPARDGSIMGQQVGRAMACGLPILASDLPRIRGRVEHEHTGLLVKPGDVEAWTEALGQAASSPMARKRWGANARAFAEAELDWARVSERFERIFETARETARQKALGSEQKEPVEPTPSNESSR